MSTMFPESSTSNSPDDDVVEKQVIDMDAEIVADNPEADFNVRTAPPNADIYPVAWSLAEKGVIAAMDKNSKPFVHVYLKGALKADAPFEDFPVNDYMNSIVQGGKGTSAVHHFMNCIGEPLPARITLSEMKEKVENALANLPLGNVECDWKASYQSGINPKNGKPAYTEIAKHMKQFKLVDELDDAGNKTGNKVRQLFIPSPKDGEPVFAQFYVVKHLTQAEAKKLKASV